jgi:hypothetical protein
MRNESIVRGFLEADVENRGGRKPRQPKDECDLEAWLRGRRRSSFPDMTEAGHPDQAENNGFAGQEIPAGSLSSTLRQDQPVLGFQAIVF